MKSLEVQRIVSLLVLAFSARTTAVHNPGQTQHPPPQTSPQPPKGTFRRLNPASKEYTQRLTARHANSYPHRFSRVRPATTSHHTGKANAARLPPTPAHGAKHLSALAIAAILGSWVAARGRLGGRVILHEARRAISRWPRGHG